MLQLFGVGVSYSLTISSKLTFTQSFEVMAMECMAIDSTVKLSCTEYALTTSHKID